MSNAFGLYAFQKENLLPDLLTPFQASEMLGVTEGTLSVWRSTGRYNLPYVKVGRKVLYSRNALESWIKDRTVNLLS